MKPLVWSIVALVAIVIIVGSLGHVLLLAACVGGGYLVGRGHERASKAIGTRKAKRALGS